MDKTELLLKCANELRVQLADALRTDRGLMSISDSLQPLFLEIESGGVTPPAVGRFDFPFHSDDSRYGSGTALFSAAAAFESALLDSASQPWFKAAFGSPDQ
jgi:hypothetical protein